MEEHCLYHFAELAKKMEISLIDLFDVVAWLIETHEFSIDRLDDNFFEDMTIFENIDEAIRENIDDECLSILLNVSKEAYLEENSMLELRSLQVVQLIDKF